MYIYVLLYYNNKKENRLQTVMHLDDSGARTMPRLSLLKRNSDDTSLVTNNIHNISITQVFLTIGITVTDEKHWGSDSIKCETSVTCSRMHAIYDNQWQCASIGRCHALTLMRQQPWRYRQCSSCSRVALYRYHWQSFSSILKYQKSAGVNRWQH